MNIFFELYFPVQKEISTEPLFLWLQRCSEEVYFPRIEQKDLRFYRIKDFSQLKPGRWGLAPDGTTKPYTKAKHYAMGIIPGIAFHQAGHRIGYGQGFFDRFLGTHPEIVRIGLAYDFQIVDFPWEASPTDQKMVRIITPSACWHSPNWKRQNCF